MTEKKYEDGCLFCRIIKGEIPCSKVFETEDILAFRDINPQAPIHILVVPKTHIKSLAELRPEDSDVAAKCLEGVAEIARQEGMKEGFRVIANTGEAAGQTVPHLHFHILAGRSLGERFV